jgi:cytochrome c-type biogenesis protein CcmF
VESDQIYDTATGWILAHIYGVAPTVATTLCAFVMGAILQEFWRGAMVRRKNANEPLPLALLNLTLKAKRRYGGYIVHVGIVLMFLGFMGAAYDHEKEGSLRPGESLQLGRYAIRYDGVHMEIDPNKRMVFTDLTILDHGQVVDHVSPAKFIYRTHPDMPTTEVAIRTTLRDDLYLIMSAVDPQSKTGTFKAILRPLVVWIWIGGIVLLFGTLVAASPTIKELLGEATSRARQRAPATAGAARAAVMLLALGSAGLALGSAARARAQDEGSSSLHAATVTIADPRERQLFERLLCMCGDCQRLPLSTCGCSEADAERAQLRRRLARGESMASIIASYREEYGPKAIAIPADQGLDRALWAVPIAAIVIAMGGGLWLGVRWSRRSSAMAARATAEPPAGGSPRTAGKPGSSTADDTRATVEDAAGRAEYDRKLDEELRDLEDS